MSEEEKLAQVLSQARTMADVTKIRSLGNKFYGALASTALGGRPNNTGIVRVSSDPALSIVERVTNGMDAMLDLGKAKKPQGNPQSPIEAAQMWYGVPAGGIQEMAESARRELGEKLKVWLDDSGESARPTVCIQDEGIGITSVDMPSTILSLNESNKVGQKWNMGTYGQGGSSSCGFARATIVISRRAPEFLNGQKDEVAWTVIMEVEKDPETYALPSYEYLVTPDGRIPTLPAEYFPHLNHGTRVTSVAYDLQGWTGPFTTGIWQLFHSALFEPVLPFLITGYRKKESTYGTRIVIGNAARLKRPDTKKRGDLEVVYSDKTKFDLGDRYGHVYFNSWVLRRPKGSSSKSDPAASYVKASDAISITLFGQRQDTEGRIWIKNRCQFPFLYKNMIIQVNANGLTPVGKNELFASTRERATKSKLKEKIYNHLAVQLRNDDELKRLNHVERERLLEQSTSASSERVRKRLAKFIKTRLKNQHRSGTGGTEKGDGGNRKKPSGRRSEGRDTDDRNLHSIPTKLEFKKERARVYQGGGAYTWVEIDAKNGYLPEQDDNLYIEWISRESADAVELSMRSQLLGGLSRWYFEASPEAAIGTYELKATLVTPNGALSDSLEIEVAPPPPAKPRNKGTEQATGPEVKWVNKEAWEAHDMGPHSVGYVTEDDEQTVIWINRHYHLLERSLKGRNLTPEAIEARAMRYQFPVACALWLQHDQIKNTDPPPSEKYQSAERERTAEAVLVASDPDVDLAIEEGED